MAVGDGPSQTGMCDAQGVCHVFGPPGEYRLTITAAGFNPRQLDVTVKGEAAGCNTCGHVDRQQLTVVLQPALGAGVGALIPAPVHRRDSSSAPRVPE